MVIKGGCCTGYTLSTLCFGLLKNEISALQDTDISPAQRDEAVRWLTDVHRCLKLYPETLCLAISVLDRFLSTIKVHVRSARTLSRVFICRAPPGVWFGLV